jgi:hypothetical protein
MPGEISKASIGAWQTGLRTAVFDAVRPSDIAGIFKAQVEKAKKGDLRAAEFVMRYCVGSPTVRVEQRHEVEHSDRSERVIEVSGPGPSDPAPDQIRAAAERIRAERKSLNGAHN